MYETAYSSLTSPAAVSAVLAELGVRPSRGLGQNFLVDAAAVDPSEPVLEIGPGLGTVTGALLARGARVTAVEKDRRLAGWLRKRFGKESAFTLVEADMLDCAAGQLPGAPFGAVVSNLPYRDGSRILVNLLREPVRPKRMVLTVQKEVAARLAARPDTREYGLLSLWTTLYYHVRQLRTVGPRCFFPVPAVASGIVHLAALPGPGPDSDTAARYVDLTRAAFRHRRKQLAGIVRAAEVDWPLDEAQCRDWLTIRGLEPDARPGVLSPADWLALAEMG